MCACSSASSSSPGSVSSRIAIWFAIVAVGRKIASSWPSSSRRTLLELVDGRILPLLLVPDLGRGDRGAHPRLSASSRCPSGDRSRAESTRSTIFHNRHVLYTGDERARRTRRPDTPPHRRAAREGEHDVRADRALPGQPARPSRGTCASCARTGWCARGDAQRRVYSLDPTPLAELDDWLGRYRAFWAHGSTRSNGAPARPKGRQ